VTDDHLMFQAIIFSAHLSLIYFASHILYLFEYVHAYTHTHTQTSKSVRHAFIVH